MATLAEARASLGLGDADAFTVRNTFTNRHGMTVARMAQTHQGARVWGAAATAVSRPDGTLTAVTRGVARDVSVSGAPRLDAAAAVAAALRDLAPKGPLGMQPKAELVVFPSRLAGGVAFRWNRAQGMVLDREYSRVGPRPAAPYVWAWEVSTFLKQPRRTA